MAKNRDDVQLTVAPEILTLNNGIVAADINVTFPVKYFNAKAVVKVTPVIVFEGGEVAGTAHFYQGSKVDDNYTVVDKKNGGNVTMHVEFPYDPRMDECALQLRAEIKCPGGKCKEFTLVNLNTGAIPTKEEAAVLAGNDAAAAALAKEFGLTVAYGLNTLQKDIKYGDLMEQMDNNFKRITTVVDKTDLLYTINSSVVTKKHEKAANLGAFKENVDKNLTNDRATQNIAVKGYASPDGPEKFNDKLSKARSESGHKVIAKLLKDSGLDIDAAAYGEDWDGFKELVEKSNIKDKNLILQVLSLYNSPAERESEIKNMSAVFNELKEEILPELRRSQIVNTTDLQGKTDAAYHLPDPGHRPQDRRRDHGRLPQRRRADRRGVPLRRSGADRLPEGAGSHPDRRFEEVQRRPRLQQPRRGPDEGRRQGCRPEVVREGRQDGFVEGAEQEPPAGQPRQQQHR